jgi:hypothetical protein
MKPANSSISLFVRPRCLESGRVLPVAVSDASCPCRPIVDSEWRTLPATTRPRATDFGVHTVPIVGLRSALPDHGEGPSAEFAKEPKASRTKANRTLIPIRHPPLTRHPRQALSPASCAICHRKWQRIEERLRSKSGRRVGVSDSPVPYEGEIGCIFDEIRNLVEPIERPAMEGWAG